LVTSIGMDQGSADLDAGVPATFAVGRAYQRFAPGIGVAAGSFGPD